MWSDALARKYGDTGFEEKSVKLIHECIATVSFSLLINRSSCGFFKANRGIK